MTVTRRNTEIRDMYNDAEGTSDIEPIIDDIKSLLKIENWEGYNIDIWFDDMQGFWRWCCDICRPLTPNP